VSECGFGGAPLRMQIHVIEGKEQRLGSRAADAAAVARSKLESLSAHAPPEAARTHTGVSGSGADVDGLSRGPSARESINESSVQVL